MTPEFGAASQLEKIDMLDFADFVAINKVRPQRAPRMRCATCASRYQRNRELFFHAQVEDMPVFGTMAARFNDDGVTALYHALKPLPWSPRASRRQARASCRPSGQAFLRWPAPSFPADRARYLAEIADRARLPRPPRSRSTVMPASARRCVRPKRHFAGAAASRRRL